MCCFIFLTTLLAAVTSVAAHGFVPTVVSDGKTGYGWNPNTDPWANPVPTRIGRKIPNDGPVMDPSSPDIACNVGGEDGTDGVFDVNAGSDITFQWNTWPTSHRGPVTTLMASCNGDCSTFKATDSQWFKIDEYGYTSYSNDNNIPNGTWGSDILMANGNQWTSNIPTGLASGQYLVRYEIVALHTEGAPQFYPGCIQVNVMNGGSDTPSSSELTSLPGMYDGFKWPQNIWYGANYGFTPAGPGVVSFAGGNSSDPSLAPSPSSVSSSSVPSYSYSPSTSPRPQSTGTPANPTSTPADPTSTPANPTSTPANPTSTPANPTSTPANPTSTPANPTSTGTCRSKKSDERSLPTHRVHRRSTRH